MPPLREQTYRRRLSSGARLVVRWETERVVVRFAVLLLAATHDGWHPVVLFDCSHGGRNDRHRYTSEGVKGQAETFHHGTPSEAMNDAIDLIKAEHERMIERWRR